MTTLTYMMFCVQVVLGNSAESPDVGHLVLKHLSPALYALLEDGLKPYTRSLFGKVRNNVWKVVEDSAELGKCTTLKK